MGWLRLTAGGRTDFHQTGGMAWHNVRPRNLEYQVPGPKPLLDTPFKRRKNSSNTFSAYWEAWIATLDFLDTRSQDRYPSVGSWYPVELVSWAGIFFCVLHRITLAFASPHRNICKQFEKKLPIPCRTPCKTYETLPEPWANCREGAS